MAAASLWKLLVPLETPRNTCKSNYGNKANVLKFHYNIMHSYVASYSIYLCLSTLCHDSFYTSTHKLLMVRGQWMVLFMVSGLLQTWAVVVWAFYSSLHLGQWSASHAMSIWPVWRPWLVCLLDTIVVPSSLLAPSLLTIIKIHNVPKEETEVFFFYCGPGISALWCLLLL